MGLTMQKKTVCSSIRDCCGEFGSQAYSRRLFAWFFLCSGVNHRSFSRACKHSVELQLPSTECRDGCPCLRHMRGDMDSLPDVGCLGAQHGRARMLMHSDRTLFHILPSMDAQGFGCDAIQRRGLAGATEFEPWANYLGTLGMAYSFDKCWLSTQWEFHPEIDPTNRRGIGSRGWLLADTP